MAKIYRIYGHKDADQNGNRVIIAYGKMVNESVLTQGYVVFDILDIEENRGPATGDNVSIDDIERNKYFVDIDWKAKYYLHDGASGVELHDVDGWVEYDHFAAVDYK